MSIVKEEEIWPNAYDIFSEAHEAIDAFVKYYNADRIHSALGCRRPGEVKEHASMEPDLRCYHHPEREAASQCDHCGDYLCAECVK